MISGFGNDPLDGAAGNDVLHGGLGNDFLTSGTGKDNFEFKTTLGASKVDSTFDFVVLDNTLRLEEVVFVGLTLGTLAASAFASNLTGTAFDRLDRLVYETDTERVYFDADGS